MDSPVVPLAAAGWLEQEEACLGYTYDGFQIRNIFRDTDWCVFCGRRRTAELAYTGGRCFFRLLSQGRVFRAEHPVV